MVACSGRLWLNVGMLNVYSEGRFGERSYLRWPRDDISLLISASLLMNGLYGFLRGKGWALCYSVQYMSLIIKNQY